VQEKKILLNIPPAIKGIKNIFSDESTFNKPIIEKYVLKKGCGEDDTNKNSPDPDADSDDLNNQGEIVGGEKPDQGNQNNNGPQTSSDPSPIQNQNNTDANSNQLPLKGSNLAGEETSSLNPMANKSKSKLKVPLNDKNSEEDNINSSAKDEDKSVHQKSNNNTNKCCNSCQCQNQSTTAQISDKQQTQLKNLLHDLHNQKTESDLDNKTSDQPTIDSNSMEKNDMNESNYKTQNKFNKKQNNICESCKTSEDENYSFIKNISVCSGQDFEIRCLKMINNKI